VKTFSKCVAITWHPISLQGKREGKYPLITRLLSKDEKASCRNSISKPGLRNIIQLLFHFTV